MSGHRKYVLLALLDAGLARAGQARLQAARNQAQRASSHFQGADQKCNQMWRMLSTIMRNLNDIKNSGAPRRSGL